MKRVTHYVMMFALLFSSYACTGEGDVQSKAAVTPPPAAPQQALEPKPEDAVNGFYQALAQKDCQKAKAFRPAYSEAKCNSVSSISVNSLRMEMNNGEKAVAYLNFTYSRNNTPQQFTGFLWLKKGAEHWEIQEDFVPVDKIGLEGFIATYIGSPKGQVAKALTKDVINDDHKPLLADLKQRFGNYSAKNIILVDISQQKLFLYGSGDQLLGSYPVSTATKGAGNQGGSDQTPLGAHRISDRIGDGAALGSIFIARKDSGKLADIITKPVDVPDDDVTTRILWLDGLEPGKNKGGNVDSHSRYIYIHGTPEEGLIGKPASHGCIRMLNKDVLEVFKQSPENTLVYIGE